MLASYMAWYDMTCHVMTWHGMTLHVITWHYITRDVNNIESIVSYLFHKTDTGIASKWQINDTFNDTFYDDINKDRVSLTQKWTIFFLLNACLVFHFYIILKLMVPEYYYTVCWIYQGQKEKSEFFNGLVRYCIVSISFCQYRYCIVS